ncbi:hypothetical protein SLEP1_g46559 [Rubroshorea leprosula]|uniref:CNNM transmembrane domain-containing protein n=1 Tax=Rubroshorea leprosula TaxID=152421 RepID=A0AAV5LNK4_9ROSI|nr:hypothetical protein SLEP1_g46559 [Rubroshorea leprosula]
MLICVRYPNLWALVILDMVAILLLAEIILKSVAVRNLTVVARFVVRPVAWLSLILSLVGRTVTYLLVGMLKVLGLKGKR